VFLLPLFVLGFISSLPQLACFSLLRVELNYHSLILKITFPVQSLKEIRSEVIIIFLFATPGLNDMEY
jgi:hypothetical protein